MYHNFGDNDRMKLILAPNDVEIPSVFQSDQKYAGKEVTAITVVKTFMNSCDVTYN